jgi:tol-pal system protein YbgF
MAGLLLPVFLALPSLAQESPPQAGEADSVSARLGRLEQKIKDLQVTIGTFESFVSTKPGAVLPQEAAPAAPGQSSAGDLAPRIDALETQITALTNQIEQMGKQMNALEAKLAAAQMPPAAPQAPNVAEPPPERQGEAPPPPADTAPASADSGENGDPSKPRWYGPKPGSDELAALLERQAAAEPQNLALPSGDAQTLYQQGYGALLQKDYAGAEIAFRQVVDSFPNDPLAANAQYWLGETYYVRGQYKNAADAFLKGYKKYKSGDKAPDTLLKLGMSLAELGQKDAACSTLVELQTKYPSAPEHIGDEAKAWRKKAGC